MTLRIHLLGPPYAEYDGEVLSVDTRKATAMLAYLAVERGVHTREELAALLWPESDERRARGALRRTLSVLKKAIGDEALQVDGDALALNDAAVWCDVFLFQSGAESGVLSELEEAAALYRDDFMTGFTLRDAPPFDEWQYFQAETWRRAAARLLERMADAHAARGAYGPAVEAARRWLALDPLREEAHQQLMRLLAWQGDRAGALRQYRNCVRVLEEELGVAPLAETTTLAAAIRENDVAPPVPPVQPPLPAGAPAETPMQAADDVEGLPFVGREAAWRTAVGAYRRVTESGRLLLIEGEAGIGKTRFLAELARWGATRDVTVLRLQAYQGERDLAYAPLIDALRQAVVEPAAAERLRVLEPVTRAETARLLPEMGAIFPDLPRLTPLSGEAGRGRFCDAVSRLLLALVRRDPPGLILVDDAHWLDDASLEVLGYLTRRLNRWPLLLVLAWRIEALDESPRLWQLGMQAQRAGLAESVTLARLSATEVGALLNAAGVDLPAERLYEESEGVPYFIDQFLAAVRTATPPGWRLPESVRDLLRERIAAVDGATLQLLQTAAVVGRDATFPLLAAASGRSEEETVAALENLLAQRLLEEREGPAGPIFDFTHHKLRAVVHDEMSLIRRRLLHQRAAEWLISAARHQPAPRAGAGQIAAHLRLAGAESEAAVYAMEAGAYARTVYANQEALNHYQAALALGYPEPAEIHEALGELHTLQGDYEAALLAFEAAAAGADPGALGRLEYRLGQVYQRQGEWDLAETCFAAAVERGATANPGWLARVETDWGWNSFQRGREREARQRAEQALALAAEDEDRLALAQAHNVLGMLARHRGEIEEARRQLEASLAAAEALGDRPIRVAALNNLALAFGDAGAPARAEARLLEALALCVEYGDRHREAALHNNLADLYHRQGNRAESMAHLKQAVTIYAEIGTSAEQWQPEIWKLTEW